MAKYLRSFGTLGVIIASTLGLIYYVQTAEGVDDGFGMSARTVGTQGLVVIGATLAILWMVLTDRVPFSFKMFVLGLVAVGAIGLVASIRRVNFTGNNFLVIDWRWSPTNEDRLAEAGRLSTGESSKVADLEPAFVQGYASHGFLGPNRAGKVSEEGLAADWWSTPATEKWRLPVGKGYAAFDVKGRLAITIEQQGTREVVSGFDISNGAALWSFGYDGLFSETMGGDGPRATPTIDGNQVFVLGATGVLSAVELLTGKVQWRVNILEDAKTKNIEWGMSGSPLVLGERVIVNPGGKAGNSLAAYDRATGKRLWSGGDEPAAYASPMLATIAGAPQVLMMGRTALVSHDLESGAELWRFAFPTFNGINVGQPIAFDDGRVFMSAGYGAGATMIQVTKENDKWSAEQAWHNNMMRCKFTSPIQHEGYIYGLDDGILVCLDAKTGTRKWKKGRYGHGQILLVGDKIVIMAETGELAICRAVPEKYEELARYRVLPGDKTWNGPALAGPNLLVRNHLEMAGYQFTPAEK